MSRGTRLQAEYDHGSVLMKELPAGKAAMRVGPLLLLPDVHSGDAALPEVTNGYHSRLSEWLHPAASSWTVTENSRSAVRRRAACRERGGLEPHGQRSRGDGQLTSSPTRVQ